MKKISSKTFFYAFLVVLISLVIFDVYIWNHTKSFLLTGLKKDLRKEVSLSKAFLGTINFADIDSQKLYQTASQIKEMTSFRATLIDKNGKVVADSEINPDSLFQVENHLYRPEVQEAMRTGSGLAKRRSTTINKELFYYCEPLRKNGRIVGFIRLAMFSPEFDERMDFLNGLIIRSNIFILIIFISFTTIYSKWLNRQVEKLRIPLANQRENPEFVKLSRHKYEEFDRIANEINHLGYKFETNLDQKESQREQLLSIFNSLEEGVAAFNRNGTAILHNLAFRDILGLSLDNEGSFRFYDWIYFPPIIEDIEEFLAKGIPVRKRTKFYGERYIDYQILPLIKDEQTLSGFLLTISDVTHLQQLETIRQDFVTNVTHEFKTPLTSIRGYAETLLSDMADKKKIRHKFLKKIEKQTIQLENLVADLLQLSRVEKKKTGELVKINPLPTIKKILQELESAAAEKNLQFIKEIAEPEKKIKIKSNKQLLQTVIANLIYNATQYCRSGSTIWFRLKIFEKLLRLEVEDNGQGIPEHEQERIFERFYRMNSARGLYAEGSGLGLSIVRHSVEMMNGRVGVESEVNKGSLFWVEIPLA